LDRRKNRGNGAGTSGRAKTDIVAEDLGVSAQSVRNYILNGDLVGRKEKEGINEGYVVSVDLLYALRDRRKHLGNLRGNFRETSRRSESTAEVSTELVRETAVDMLRETLAALVRESSRGLGLGVAEGESILCLSRT
jgi:hypothetical protein